MKSKELNRLQVWSQMAGERGLLEVIQDVHMTNTGAMERSIEDQDKDIAALNKRMETWYNSNLAYDTCVLCLMQIVLEEKRLK